MMLGLCAASASAQTLDLLGVYSTPGGETLKAVIDAGEKEVESVKTVSFNMQNGGKPEELQSYDIFEGKYVTADVVSAPGVEYAYRMVVNFTDGTNIVSDCVEVSGETFKWLGDLKWSSYSSGYLSPVVDRGIENNNVIVNGQTYYKQVGNHAAGYLEYKLDSPYTRFVSRFGTIDANNYGDLRFKFLADGVVKHEQVVFAKTNPSIGSNPCIYDVDMSLEGVQTLRFNFEIYDGNNWGDHGHLLLARLYLPQEEEKEPQTIAFETKGGEVPSSVTSIDLKATASSGMPVYYRVVKGDAEITDGSHLVFGDNASGEVVVEAIQFGDDTYACAVGTLVFNVDFKPTVTVLGSQMSATGEEFVYVFVDAKNRMMSSLKMKLFNNPDQKVSAGELDLANYASDATFSQPQVLVIPKSVMLSDFYMFVADFSDGKEPATVSSNYFDGTSEMVYVSDTNYYKLSSNYNNAVAVDKSVSSNPSILLGGKTYPKGFGVHAVGVATFAFPTGVYNRFVTTVGKQSGQGGNIAFVLSGNGVQMASTGNINQSSPVKWDYPLASDIYELKLNVNDGGDNIGSDHGSIGGTRLYFTPKERKSQSISWMDSKSLSVYKPVDVKLTAKASSGLPVQYRLIEGSEWAEVKENGVLRIHTAPEGVVTVKVEAYQPGNNNWAIAPTKVCTFTVSNGFVVERDETLKLSGGDVLDELTIYADAYSSGQVLVEDGVVTVKNLILKYTFRPSEYTYVSFPSSMNLAQVSNFEELGFAYSLEGLGKSYTIYEYDTRMHAADPTAFNWKALSEPKVQGGKGYVFRLNGGLADDVEVTFTVDNANLEFENSIDLLNLTLDFGTTEPGIRQAVYVRPKNVNGNTLRIDVDYKPSDLSALPINHERALADARVTYVPGFAGIRLTLPDNTPAKVAIYDASGEKLVKAVRYVSPMMIDIRDLKAGNYQMIVSYGNAIGVKTFVKPNIK